MSERPLTREDVIAGLRDLIAELRTAGVHGRVRLVGGAAIWLEHADHRTMTADIDAVLTPREDILPIARRVGTRRGFRDDWLNDAAAKFVPSGLGSEAGWIVLFDEDGVVIEVADDRTLLAMKLQALNSRGRRDIQDVVALVGKLGLMSVDDVEAVYEEYFPGDALADNAYRLLHAAFQRGIPSISPPARIDLTPR